MNFVEYLAPFIISMLFFIGGYIYLQVNLYQIRNWSKTTATVIEHEQGFDETASVYSEVVKFNIKEKEIIARTNVQSGFPRKTGRQVTILYNPDEPNVFIPYSVMSLYAAPCAFMLIGVVPIGIIGYFSITGN